MILESELKQKLNNKKKSKQLNYRLSAFPYRKFVEYIDYKFQERGLGVVEVNAKKTSITCPVCGYTDKRNRIDKESFKCRRCGFEFNAQYVACLNLFSRSDDGSVAIRGGRLYLASVRQAYDAWRLAPDEPPIGMKWLKKFVQFFKHSYQKIKHGQPLFVMEMRLEFGKGF